MRQSPSELLLKKKKHLYSLKLIFFPKQKRKNKNRSSSVTIILTNILDLYNRILPLPYFYSVHREQ